LPRLLLSTVTAYSVMAPDVVIRPIVSDSVNHTAPSGPTVMPDPLVRPPTGYRVSDTVGCASAGNAQLSAAWTMNGIRRFLVRIAIGRHSTCLFDMDCFLCKAVDCALTSILSSTSVQLLVFAAQKFQIKSFGSASGAQPGVLGSDQRRCTSLH